MAGIEGNGDRFDNEGNREYDNEAAAVGEEDREEVPVESMEMEPNRALLIVQMLLGFVGTLTNVFLLPEIQRRFQEEVSRRRRWTPEGSYLPDPNIRLKYCSYNSRIHLKCLDNIEAETVIFPCCGSIVDSGGVNIEQYMIKTPLPFLIDGRQASSLWRLLLLSCQPNCHLVHVFTKDKDGKGYYQCYLETIANVPAGSILSVHPSDLNNDKNLDMSACTCGAYNCVSGSGKIFNCPVATCPRHKDPFKTEGALKGHLTKYHKEKDPNAPAEEYWECEEPDCPRKGSKINLRNPENKRRHIREFHENVDEDGKRIMIKCRFCGEEYTRKHDYEKHFTENKLGCKGLDKIQREKGKSRPMGPLTIKILGPTKTSGYDLVELPFKVPPSAPKKKGPTSRHIQKRPKALDSVASSSITGGSTTSSSGALSSSSFPSDPFASTGSSSANSQELPDPLHPHIQISVGPEMEMSSQGQVVTGGRSPALVPQSHDATSSLEGGQVAAQTSSTSSQGSISSNKSNKSKAAAKDKSSKNKKKGGGGGAKK